MMMYTFDVNRASAVHPSVLEERAMNEFPKVVYHYTSLDVLEKISRNREIWATDISYLNDSSEYTHARTCIQEALETKTREDHALRSTVVAHLKAFEKNKREWYITSFSEASDSLSQWRAYCPKGQGVAIGFLAESIDTCDKDFVREVMALSGTALMGFIYGLNKCVYSQSEKQAHIEERLKAYLTAITDKGPNSKEAISQLMWLDILCGPYFKDERFKEEQEWRLVVSFTYRFKRLNFRVGQSTLIPYISLRVPEQFEDAFIQEVTIGPTPNPELSKQAVQELLISRGISSAAVKNSEIPFRNW